MRQINNAEWDSEGNPLFSADQLECEVKSADNRGQLKGFLIGITVAAFGFILLQKCQGIPAPSPEAQMDDTLLIDHSRIPEDTIQSHEFSTKERRDSL